MGKVSVSVQTEVLERGARESQGEAYDRNPFRVVRSPYFPTGDEKLQLLRIDMDPNADVEPHAHTEDEIIYLLAGEIHLGARVLGAGDALLVEANTLYSFTSGPEGCSFLNFRPTTTVGYLSKEDFLAQRSARLPGEVRPD